MFTVNVHTGRTSLEVHGDVTFEQPQEYTEPFDSKRTVRYSTVSFDVTFSRVTFGPDKGKPQVRVGTVAIGKRIRKDGSLGSDVRVSPGFDATIRAQVVAFAVQAIRSNLDDLLGGDTSS